MSTNPAISADGTSVAFLSTAANLVARHTNTVQDVFVRDLSTGTTVEATVSPTGEPSNSKSLFTERAAPALSADGRFVAFASSASHLVSDDTNGQADLFVRDLLAGTTVRVNVAPDGTEVKSAFLLLAPHYVAISADGRRVAFSSVSTALVPGDTNGVEDIFVRDLENKTTVNITAGMKEPSREPSLSADGRYVGFEYFAPPGSKGFAALHDLDTGKLTWLSILQGRTTLGQGRQVRISADGRYAAFISNWNANAPDKVYVRGPLS